MFIQNNREMLLHELGKYIFKDLKLFPQQLSSLWEYSRAITRPRGGHDATIQHSQGIRRDGNDRFATVGTPSLDDWR